MYGWRGCLYCGARLCIELCYSVRCIVIVQRLWWHAMHFQGAGGVKLCFQCNEDGSKFKLFFLLSLFILLFSSIFSRHNPKRVLSSQTVDDRTFKPRQILAYLIHPPPLAVLFRYSLHNNETHTLTPSHTPTQPVSQVYIHTTTLIKSNASVQIYQQCYSSSYTVGSETCQQPL